MFGINVGELWLTRRPFLIYGMYQKPRPFSDLLRIFGQFTAAFPSRKIYNRSESNFRLSASSNLFAFISLFVPDSLYRSLYSSLLPFEKFAPDAASLLRHLYYYNSPKRLNRKRKLYYFCSKISQRRPITA